MRWYHAGVTCFDKNFITPVSSYSTLFNRPIIFRRLISARKSRKRIVVVSGAYSLWSIYRSLELAQLRECIVIAPGPNPMHVISSWRCFLPYLLPRVLCISTCTCCAKTATYTVSAVRPTPPPAPFDFATTAVAAAAAAAPVRRREEGAAATIPPLLVATLQ